MIWFIADPHFGHANIIKYASRPFDDLGQMMQAMLKRWQHSVKPGDLVYVLGDFAIGKLGYTKSLLDYLYGTKILIHGNHDRGHRAMESYGFAACMSSAVLKLDGLNILLQHRPLYDPLPKGIDGVLHGHIHRGKLGDLYEAGECAYIPPYNVNLCVELWQYVPVSYKTAVKKLRRQVNV